MQTYIENILGNSVAIPCILEVIREAPTWPSEGFQESSPDDEREGKPVKAKNRWEKFNIAP
jgi:hypothetical protein